MSLFHCLNVIIRNTHLSENKTSFTTENEQVV